MYFTPLIKSKLWELVIKIIPILDMYTCKLSERIKLIIKNIIYMMEKYIIAKFKDNVGQQLYLNKSNKFSCLGYFMFDYLANYLI